MLSKVFLWMKSFQHLTTSYNCFPYEFFSEKLRQKSGSNIFHTDGIHMTSLVYGLSGVRKCDSFNKIVFHNLPTHGFIQL